MSHDTDNDGQFGHGMGNLKPSPDKDGVKAIEALPPVGAYLCESTARFADYWLKAARTAGAKEYAVMAAEQAVNGWKNLAYDLARQAHYYLMSQPQYALSHARENVLAREHALSDGFGSAPSTTPQKTVSAPSLYSREDQLTELLWQLYAGIYGHRKAESIDPFKTAVAGALELAKAWRERGEPAERELADEKGRRQRWQKLADQRAIEVADLRTSAASATPRNTDPHGLLPLLAPFYGLEPMDAADVLRTLIKDAERYRWFKSQAVVYEQIGAAPFWTTRFILNGKVDFDAAIDAQMAAMNNRADGGKATNG